MADAMAECSVPGCESRPKINDNYTFHRLPRTPRLRARWLAALRCSPDVTSACAHVCSRHFEASMFTERGKKRLLFKNAVPTLLLSHSATKRQAEAGVGSGLVACRVCLDADGRLLPISGSGLEDTFVELTGIPLEIEGFPRHMCACCRTRLSKCAAFRDSCQRSTALLRTLLERSPVNSLVTMDDIRAIDRKAHKLTHGLTWEKVVHLNPVKIEDNQTLDLLNESYTDVVYLESEQKSFINDDNMYTSETGIHLKINKVESEDAMSVDSSERGECVDAEPDIVCDGNMESVAINENVENIEEINEPQNRTESGSLKSKREISTKTTETDTGNTVARSRKKRKKIGDNYKFEAFEKECNVKVRVLSKEEQRQEIEEKIKTNKSKYCCKTCGKDFKYENTMKKHLLCHDPSAGPIECEICRSRFRSKTENRWRRHRDQHRVTFTCRTCGFVSRIKTSAKLHSLVHTGHMYSCRHCGQEYKYKTSYFNHMREQHPSENVACDECGETFLSDLAVRQHKARAHGNTESKNFKCSVCEVSFSSAEARDKHMRSGVGVSHAALFPCGACGESCGSDAARTAHMAEKHPADQHYCKECCVTFASAASFSLHARRKHLGVRGHGARRSGPRGAGPAPRAVCDVCGRSIQSEAALKFHLYTHMDQKPFACSVCPKTFAVAAARELHLRSHTGERPYQCAHCSLAFALKSNLVRHMERVHLKRIRRYPCNICLKTFTTAWSVKLHVSTVHNNMPVPKRVRRPKKTADT